MSIQIWAFSIPVWEPLSEGQMKNEQPPHGKMKQSDYFDSAQQALFQENIGYRMKDGLIWHAFQSFYSDAWYKKKSQVKMSRKKAWAHSIRDYTIIFSMKCVRNMKNDVKRGGRYVVGILNDEQSDPGMHTVYLHSVSEHFPRSSHRKVQASHIKKITFFLGSHSALSHKVNS